MITARTPQTVGDGLDKALDEARPWVLSAYRVVIGFLFACHGGSTIFDIPDVGSHRMVAATGSWPSWWAALIELVGGLLVMIGLRTRVAALLCAGTMAFAYFDVHQRHGLLPLGNGGEAAVLFCWAFLAIAVLGSGRFSVDRFMHAPPVD